MPSVPILPPIFVFLVNALPAVKTLPLRKAIRAAGLVATAALAWTFASAQATDEPAEPLLTLDEAIAAALEAT